MLGFGGRLQRHRTGRVDGKFNGRVFEGVAAVMSERFEFQEVQAFASGALGQPGQRTFFLQTRGQGMVRGMIQGSVLRRNLPDSITSKRLP